MICGKNRQINPQVVRIVSDMPRLDRVCTERFVAANKRIGSDDTIWSGIRLFFETFRHDVVLLNSNTCRLLVLCALRWLFPFQRCRLVALDIHLSQPKGWEQRAIAWVKRLLLRKVDWFIHYFKDLEGYDRFYSIGARSTCVPFKVNYIEAVPAIAELSSDGEYVFTAGRSFRDLPTFIAAMRLVPYPGILLYQDASLMKDFGTNLDLSDLPSNLRAEKHDGEKSWVEHLQRAKLVVVPIRTDCMYAAGLSLYPMAMALKKCVIATNGPSTRGLLTGEEAIVISPGDPVAMADAIRGAWENKDLRERVANAGRRYAERLGGEARLLSDILEICGELVDEKIVKALRKRRPP